MQDNAEKLKTHIIVQTTERILEQEAHARKKVATTKETFQKFVVMYHSGRATSECWGPVGTGFWDQFWVLRNARKRRKDNWHTFMDQRANERRLLQAIRHFMG